MARTLGCFDLIRRLDDRNPEDLESNGDGAGRRQRFQIGVFKPVLSFSVFSDILEVKGEDQINRFFGDKETLEQMKAGPLGRYIDRYADQLEAGHGTTATPSGVFSSGGSSHIEPKHL